MMADSPLLTKSKAFALEIIRACNEIKHGKKENILTNQLLRNKHRREYPGSLLCTQQSRLYRKTPNCLEGMLRK